MMDGSEEHCNPTMDGETICVETEMYRLSKKLKTCEAKRDFISDLPDPILVHILSFLPLKDAVKTVVLPRFGKMWLNMPVLDLDNCAYHEYEGFMGIIRQVWNHPSDRTLDKVRLRFPFSCPFSKSESVRDLDNEDYEKRGEEIDAADQIEKLISYAISRKVKVLDLNFMGCDFLLSVDRHHELPDVFSSNHLVDLQLASCRIRSLENMNLPALRVLFLDDVSLSDKVMVEVLLQCPLLEHMSLVCCYGLESLNCENLNLKKLKIALNYEGTRLFISCPHVLSLEMSGLIERATLLDVSSLVDASISFSEGSFRCEQRSYDDVLRLMLKLRKCKNFSTRRWSIMVLSIWELTRMLRCPCFEWKNIKVKLDLTKWQLPGLSLLLRCSRRVETLDMYIFPRHDQFFRSEHAKWIWGYDFDGDNFWESQAATFHFLETISIYGHVDEPYMVQLVKFLLKNAPKLMKLVISTKTPFATEERD